jgi:hypothetical protein
MKKFLFTLAALMMMGTAYADDYLYVKDFEVAEADLGTDELAIPIAAHFDYAVSAWEVWINLPETGGDPGDRTGVRRKEPRFNERM